MKKFFLFLITLCIGINAWAYDCEVDGIYYNLDETNMTASVVSGNCKDSINIPESMIYSGETYKVTSIKSGAFNRCHSLILVTIPNSVTKIEDFVFGGCSSLASIEIPNSVDSIRNYTFGVCSSLNSIEISNSVSWIGDSAFYDCTSLVSITMHT